MKYETKLLLWAALVALVISLAVAWGCGCTFSFMRLKERFADGAEEKGEEADEDAVEGDEVDQPKPKKAKVPKKPVPTLKNLESASTDLSKKEQELFEDLKNNKLSEKEVMNLVKTGILNEALVEKFLAKLDASAEELASEDAELRTAHKTGGAKAASAKEDEGGVVEGFSADGYGYARF